MALTRMIGMGRFGFLALSSVFGVPLHLARWCDARLTGM